MRTLIKNGTVVNPTGPQPADVLVDGETIAAVLSRGARVIDGGRFLGRAGHGRYLPRGLSTYLR